VFSFAGCVRNVGLLLLSNPLWNFCQLFFLAINTRKIPSLSYSHPPAQQLSKKMAQFDESKAYASQEDVFFDDGRETELLRFIYDKPDIDEIRGSPEKVLAAIDEFGRTQKYLMNVGEDKGKIVSNLIAEVKPETMVRNP
jgi:hypothetical protein